MSRHVHLGFEVGTGNPVEIPLLNTAVTGMTQDSGKTTTLEAMAARAGVPAIAFVTKRGERSFESGHRLLPYFRDRADWQFVSSIIDAQLQERNKFLRPWLIKICRTTQTLADVWKAVREAMKTARGINEGVYTQLDAYLELIVPTIERIPFSRSLILEPGLNVMDVSNYETPMQMLFVQSAIDWINANERKIITIVPEAWEFIPEGKSSPVKASAISLVRKGSGIGNHIWVDSQDMAGVDKTILRGCAVWLIGVQREANEIKRNLANIPAGVKRPKAEDIAGLRRGQFFACWKDRVVKTYVQPAWCTDNQLAKHAALNRTTVIVDDTHLEVHSGYRAGKTLNEPIRQEDTVNEVEARELRKENERLRLKVQDLENEILAAREDHSRQSTRADQTASPIDERAMFERWRLLLIREAPALLKVIATVPELEISKQRQTITQDLDTPLGRVGYLIANKFFDEPRSIAQGYKELQRIGNAGANPRFYEAVAKAHTMGFLTREGDGFQAVKGMKVRITEAG